MTIQQGYDQWAEQYDTNYNRTRDLEAIALKETLEGLSFKTCLEIGCGTGKNTAWLSEKAESILSVDFSEEMLSRAKQKIQSKNVEFQWADITSPWDFAKDQYNLISFSLVLEHIEDLDFIFEQVSKVLNSGGHVYIGELHPFKQYTGSKARFDALEGTKVLECFAHHISAFVQTAKKHGLQIDSVQEYFDDDNHAGMPRLLTLLFSKK